MDQMELWAEARGSTCSYGTRQDRRGRHVLPSALATLTWAGKGSQLARLHLVSWVARLVCGQPEGTAIGTFSLRSTEMGIFLFGTHSFFSHFRLFPIAFSCLLTCKGVLRLPALFLSDTEARWNIWLAWLNQATGYLTKINDVTSWCKATFRQLQPPWRIFSSVCVLLWYAGTCVMWGPRLTSGLFFDCSLPDSLRRDLSLEPSAHRSSWSVACFENPASVFCVPELHTGLCNYVTMSLWSAMPTWHLCGFWGTKSACQAYIGNILTTEPSP